MFYPQENRGATVRPVKVRTPLATKGDNALAHAQTQFGTAHPKQMGWNLVGNPIHCKKVSWCLPLNVTAERRLPSAHVRLLGKITYFPDSPQV